MGVTRGGLYFKEVVVFAPLQGEVAAAMGLSSGEDLKFLLIAIVFACIDLGEPAKVKLYFFDETWPDAILGLLVI